MYRDVVRGMCVIGLGRLTVEVAFNLDRDGTVRGNDVRLLSSQGDSSAVGTAFEAARRAILPLKEFVSLCLRFGHLLGVDAFAK